MNIRDKIYQYFEQKPALRVLLVFSAEISGIRSEIEDCDEPWRDGFLYHVFEGDWFTTKYRLANEWTDKKVVLLFPTIPQPVGKEACSRFPLMSVMEANMVFHEEDAIAFMQQRGIAPQFRDFFERHISELRRDTYNRVLSAYYSPGTFSFDVAYRGILTVYLGSDKMMEWHQIIARIVILCADNPEKAAAFWSRLGKAMDVKAALDQRLIALVGFSYDAKAEERMRTVVEAIKYNAVTQNLAADSADPYKSLKIVNSVQIQSINSLISAIAENTKLNALWLPAFEKLGQNVREETLINTYGTEANYAYMPEMMCRYIMTKTVADALCSDPSAVLERLLVIERNIAEDSSLRFVIDYARAAAHYYETANDIDTIKLNTPELYIEKYVSAFCLLDRYYRQAVMAFVGISAEERADVIEASKKRLDSDYAALMNEINLEWVRCIKEKGTGFETIASVARQPDFYKDSLNNKRDKVAVIVSDALRYEMGEELVALLGEKKHVASVTPMLAMLPTETKYTKTALLPHETLTFKDNEMEVDGKVLITTEQRTAHLQNYVEQGYCCDYDTLMAMSKAEKREIFKRPLVYVFHNTIDKNCHGCSANTFASACKVALEELLQLVLFIHDTANVTEVYVTADHGFLYNDMPFEEKDKLVVEEETVEKKSRYYITPSAASPQIGTTKFPLQSVSAMQADCFVSVPTGTNRLAVQGGDYEFAHGGASLQELIVPLIYSKYKRDNLKRKVSVNLLEQTLTIASSRLKAHLVQGEAVSMNVQKLTVECAIYVNDKQVSRTQTITLDSTDEEMGASRIYTIDLTVAAATTSKIMQLKIFEVKDRKGVDRLNPLIQKNIINNTLIEQDDF